MHFDLEAALLRLKSEFIESSFDKLDDIDTIINDIFNGNEYGQEQLYQLKRDIHSIKGSAGTHGMHLLTLVAHRLEDFMEAAPKLSTDHWYRVQAYIDVMRKLLNKGTEPEEEEKQKIIVSLPHAQSSNTQFSEQKKRKATILIVMPQGVQRKVIGKELASCGFDLSFTDRPVEAIRLVMELKPDAVISDQEFRNMCGNELANVLQEIHSTKETPFALLTASKERDFIVPQSTHIIHKSSSFIEQLTTYLVDIGLFGRL